MLRSIAAFEWRLQTRQPAFLAAAVFLAGMGFALPAGGFGAENLHVNSPWLVMESQGFLSILTLFVAAIFASAAVLRDAEHGTEEMVWSTPVGRLPYLLGRFLGAFAATLTCALFAVAGMVAAVRMPWLDPERVAPLSAVSYGWPLLVVVLPNVLFATALLFAVATLTRSAIATHAAAVAGYVLYLAGAAMTDSPLMAGAAPGKGSGILAALLDPFGLSSFFADTRYWSIAEKNSRLVPLAGTMLLNRAIWIAVAAVTTAVAWRAFSFRSAKERSGPGEAAEEKLAAGRTVAALPRVQPESGGWKAGGAAFLSTARLEIRALFRSVPFLLLLAVWAGLALSEIHSGVLDGEYDSASLPATSLVLSSLMQPLGLVGVVLLLFYGAEIFWRERRYRFAPLSDATPAPGAAVFAARFAALVSIALTVIAVGVACGVAVQLARGYPELDVPLYLSFFYFTGVPLVLFAAGSAFVHAALSPGRYAGLVLVLLCALFTIFGGGLGVESRLFRFGAMPPVSFSEMSGTAWQAVPFHWFALHWGSLAGLMLIAAGLLKRGMDRPVRERLRLLVSSAGRGSRVAAALLAATAIGSGAWIVWNTRVLNPAVSRDDRLEWRAAYERAYGHVGSAPQPSVAAVAARVDLQPEMRRAAVSGTLVLRNDGHAPLRRLWVFVDREAREAALSIGGAEAGTHDARFGMYRFDLASPIPPGGRVPLRFRLELAARGFEEGEQDDSIVENGTFLMSHRFLPSIGYRRDLEITDARERRRRGLPPRRTGEEDEEVLLASAAGEARRSDLLLTISTSPGQIAVAPGRLERRWVARGRNWFRYRTEAPVLNHFAVLSARYARAVRDVGGVQVEVLHHPRHARNAGQALDAAAETLAYCRTNFGPYPHRELRMAEVPSFGGGGSGIAFPGLIGLFEARFFLTDTRDATRPDLVGRRVAHEVAHQWWGYGLSPLPVDGAAAITESLTKYTELRVIERMHGAAAVRRFLEIELDRYLTGRSHEEREEVPLFRVRDRPYVYYSKGAVVLTAAARLVGEPAMNSALSRLFASGRGTTAALLDELRRVASPRDFRLIDEWIREIVLYDLAVESASAGKLAGGRYEVRARVRAGKSVAAADGREIPRPMRERIGVVVWGAGGETLYSGERELTDGTGELTVVVSSPPARLALDPEVTRIDRNRFDNAAAVTPGR